MISAFLRTYGCSANQNDSEIMTGLLENSGIKLVKKPEQADIIIINTCIVKGKTESRMYKAIRESLEKYPTKKLIVAGCLPQAKLPLPSDKISTIGPHNLSDIVSVINSALAGKPSHAIDKTHLVKVSLPKHNINKYINIIQILEGCSGVCSYCIVKQAKPELYSFPEDPIISEIKKGIGSRAKEIWLTSQDNASYKRDTINKSGLPELLKKINKIEGTFLVRVGMMNPDTIMPALDEFIETYKSSKIFKFLHIPVQSGNNRILQLMNRKYSVENFEEIIRRFRAAFPAISISTDIICGFPGETETEFGDSLNLIKKIKPDVLNISRFFPRPKTPAEKMPGMIHGSITKIRSEKLTTLFEKISGPINETWIGWTGEIYVDEKGKNSTLIGRNFCYKPVVIKAEPGMLGKTVTVKITAAKNHYLLGEILSG